ncbi:uncharacterized protein METZ01_LOCUS190438 [marine metagenome]|uniref:Uncharacterized protein n=1 Tax=marine metagenome TaxID=408172 RepID=A0A382DHY3_9ZZZZ
MEPISFDGSYVSMLHYFIGSIAEGVATVAGIN